MRPKEKEIWARILVTQKDELEQLLRKLFSDQLLAVLGTQSQNGPYGSLVAFYATDDLKHLLFATKRSTRKYDNLSRTPQAAMVIDNRSNKEGDFHKATAVTAMGTVKEVDGPEKEQLRALYLSKHPGLSDFVQSPACALLKIEVETYYIVRQFQQVTELRITP
jgi:nitroimidazol reductase NimA-like FMN-containing flavoprotein (pyridoxamine 5'-phosphate oxidase superfamily)